MNKADKITWTVAIVSALLTLAFCLAVIVDMIGTAERTTQVVMILSFGTISTTVMTCLSFAVGGGITNDIIEKL